MAILYIMMGYPGSGKTTVSSYIHDLTGAVHLWADQIRCQRADNKPTYKPDETKALYQHLNEVTDELLSTGQSVVYDTNFNRYKDRQTIRGIAAKHDVPVKLVWVFTPKDIAKTRATQNAHQQGTRILGNMPEKVFNHLAGGLEEPRPEEHAIILDGTSINAAYVRVQLGLN